MNSFIDLNANERKHATLTVSGLAPTAPAQINAFVVTVESIAQTQATSSPVTKVSPRTQLLAQQLSNSMASFSSSMTTFITRLWESDLIVTNERISRFFFVQFTAPCSAAGIVSGSSTANGCSCKVNIIAFKSLSSIIH